MKIIVCIKQVLDTAAKIEIQTGRVNEEGVPRIINPYDEFALEEAIRIKEKREEVEITLITFGPEKSKDALRTGLAMGADDAVHIFDPELEGLDPLGNAQVLAKAVQSMPFDLILCGRQAVDDDMAQVGPALAVLLNIPCITVVTRLELNQGDKGAVVTRQIEGGSEILETSLPAVLTCQKGLNEPRLPSLKGIMKAKKKEIKSLDAQSLNLEIAGLKKTGYQVESLTLPSKKKQAVILEGELGDMASKLVQTLRDEARVI